MGDSAFVLTSAETMGLFYIYIKKLNFIFFQMGWQGREERGVEEKEAAPLRSGSRGHTNGNS